MSERRALPARHSLIPESNEVFSSRQKVDKLRASRPTGHTSAGDCSGRATPGRRHEIE